MSKNDIKEILKYFKIYQYREEGNKYYHLENDDFKIIITSGEGMLPFGRNIDKNQVYQLNSDHQIQGIELKTIKDLKDRFKSFTGEELEKVA